MAHDRLILNQFDNTSSNASLKLLNKRLGNTEVPVQYYSSTTAGANDMAKQLIQHGGMSQQQRMIKDKRRSLDKATLYSYQRAFVKKYNNNGTYGNVCLALINPDKTKMDYDDKILSIGFEYGFQPGDIFEWYNTNTKWLIYLQDLNELAYFRAEIRRCNNEIKWEDENNVQHITYASIQGTNQASLKSLNGHGISLDLPNDAIQILIPKNQETLKYFERYSKFYLPDADEPTNKTCWRVEHVNTFSAPGILILTAKEYYSNTQQDDVTNGIVDKFVVEPVDPNEHSDTDLIYIVGETFIKPKREYTYSIGAKMAGTWSVDSKYPVQLEQMLDDNGCNCVKLIWQANYSGQFELHFQNYTKTIVAESLF